MNELTKIVDFEYEIYTAPDGMYGSKDSNEEWTGLIGELINTKADLALASLSVLPEREIVVDFTIPYYEPVGITILMKKRKDVTSIFKFLQVMKTQVWLGIVGCYAITSVIMWIFDRWSPYSYQNNREAFEDEDEQRYFSFKESFWQCMTALTPQGGGEFVWPAGLGHLVALRLHNSRLVHSQLGCFPYRGQVGVNHHEFGCPYTAKRSYVRYFCINSSIIHLNLAMPRYLDPLQRW